MKGVGQSIRKLFVSSDNPNENEARRTSTLRGWLRPRANTVTNVNRPSTASTQTRRPLGSPFPWTNRRTNVNHEVPEHDDGAQRQPVFVASAIPVAPTGEKLVQAITERYPALPVDALRVSLAALMNASRVTHALEIDARDVLDCMNPKQLERWEGDAAIACLLWTLGQDPNRPAIDWQTALPHRSADELEQLRQSIDYAIEHPFEHGSSSGSDGTRSSAVTSENDDPDAADFVEPLPALQPNAPRPTMDQMIHATGASPAHEASARVAHFCMYPGQLESWGEDAAIGCLLWALNRDQTREPLNWVTALPHRSPNEIRELGQHIRYALQNPFDGTPPGAPEELSAASSPSYETTDGDESEVNSQDLHLATSLLDTYHTLLPDAPDLVDDGELARLIHDWSISRLEVARAMNQMVERRELLQTWKYDGVVACLMRAMENRPEGQGPTEWLVDLEKERLDELQRDFPDPSEPASHA